MSAAARRSPLREPPRTLPGASLRRAIIGQIWPMFPLMFALGVMVGAGGAAALARWTPIPMGMVTIVATLGSVAVLLAMYRYVNTFPARLEPLEKGIAGEITVSHALDQLRVDGYDILHDLPFDRTHDADDLTGESPNIDHVAIGPGGVFTIETKFRSKGKGEEIVFDGERLMIDGREVCEGAISQTLGNARRIGEILSNVTGRRVTAQPVLVFAGRWFIRDLRRAGDRNAIWVLNDDAIVKWIRNATPRLSGTDIALYATRLREYSRPHA
jgi:hypothetical protein